MDFRDPKTQRLLLVALGFIMVVYFWNSKIYQSA